MTMMSMMLAAGGRATYSGTMTQAQVTDGSTFDFRGGPGASGGSLSPTTMSDGNVISAWYDSLLGTVECVFAVTMPDPGGQNNYISQVTGHGTTKTMASATSYAYAAGNATWKWSAQAFGFATTGTTACSSP
jgi:hypothetical protein